MDRKIENRKKVFFKTIGNILTVVSIVYIIIAIKNMDIGLFYRVEKSKIVIAMAIGTAVSLVGLWILSYAWKLILEAFASNRVSFESAWIIYFKANLGKYIPGNIVHYIERNLFARNLGIKQTFLALSSVVETGMLVVVAISVAIVFSYENVLTIIGTLEMHNFIYIMLLGFLLFISFLFGLKKHSKKFNLVWNEAKSIMSIKALSFLFLKLYVLYMIVLAGNGICFAFIIKYIFLVELSSTTFFTLVSCYILSWVVGFCVPGAPGGIGIREFILILLVGELIAREDIYIAVIMQRLMSVLGDVLAYFFSALWRKHFKIERL